MPHSLEAVGFFVRLFVWAFLLCFVSTIPVPTSGLTTLKGLYILERVGT